MSKAEIEKKISKKKLKSTQVYSTNQSAMM
jgi:hypothetical protein